MTALIFLVVLFPLGGAIGVASGLRARGAGGAQIVGAVASLGTALALAVEVGHRHVQGLDGFLYADSLSVFFAITISAVIVMASLGSAAYLRVEEDRRHFSSLQVRLYFIFFSIFASGMLGCVFAGNLGLLWVLIEASTLASAALVGLEAHARALEAAWKYVIISSFGVTIALLATLWLFYAGSALHLTSNQRLTWSFLYLHASALQTGSLRLAFLLAVIGYGTKVGLAPMHTWLPDAHSEAPSPASAMLSAALLTTGIYAIIRFLAIARVGLGVAYPDHVLLVFGFVTVFIGVIFMVRQGNFKRTFAYSSIEHMGIVAIALGFGGVIGLYAALLQILNHAIGKAVLFLSSGHLTLGYGTRETSEVRGALSTLPLAGGALVLASLAVAGAPPFGVFLSELTVLRAGFSDSTPFLAGLLLLLLAIGFVALIGNTLAMATGNAPDLAVNPYPRRSGRVLAAAPLVGGLIALLLLGVWIPGGLNGLITHAVKAIS
ncbi:MAG: proton-conducting transporter membrane subunit [Acidimicrobiales bacterium]